MNRTATIVAGAVAVIVIGGLIFYSMGKANPTATTPNPNLPNTGSVPANSTPPNPSAQSGSPVVTTSPRTSVSDTAAGVVGLVNPEGPFTTYWFEYGTSPSLGSRIASQLVGSGFQSITTPAFITGLVRNTTYYYRLVAQNSLGTQAGVTYSFQTTVGNPPLSGSAPSTRTLAATGVTRTSANLSGQVTPNSVPTQFWFEFGQSPNLGQASVLQNVGDGSTAVSESFSLSSLNPSTTYYFRLNAENQFGITNGSILNFTTSGPVTPSPASPTAATRDASNISSTGATLRGTVNTNGAETTYWFEYSTDANFASSLLQTTTHNLADSGGSTSVSADISELARNTTYFFRLVAQNALGITRGDRASFKTRSNNGGN